MKSLLLLLPLAFAGTLGCSTDDKHAALVGGPGAGGGSNAGAGNFDAGSSGFGGGDGGQGSGSGGGSNGGNAGSTNGGSSGNAGASGDGGSSGGGDTGAGGLGAGSGGDFGNGGASSAGGSGTGTGGGAADACTLAIGVDPCDGCVHFHCNTECLACQGDAECVAIVNCIRTTCIGAGGALDKICAQNCRTQHAAGGTAFNSVVFGCGQTSCGSFCPF
ncbi:MAG TPA: hypothetical protein VHE30_04740 [Polyangiaceae bacterium]|nr:hypothetical protein [Polyangiaceae bacterium]